jgi:hypothetical protein
VKDAPQTTGAEGVSADPRQLENAFVLEEKTIDSGYIIGSKPGVIRGYRLVFNFADPNLAICSRTLSKHLCTTGSQNCILRH